MQQGKKILIIAYYWPPSGGVGVQRWMHFAVNLKKLGFEPVVYTPSNPQFEIRDEQLLEFVKEIRVIKKPIWEPFGLFHTLTRNKNRGKVKQGLVLEKSDKSLLDKLIIWLRGNVLIPDPRRFWIKPSVRFLTELHQKEQFDWMITTGPPHSMHLIGRDVKKHFPDLRWLADFRDPWSAWDVLDKLSTGAFARSQHRRWERQVVKAADLITATTSSMAKGFQKHGNVNVAVISNGTDRTECKDPSGSASFFKMGYYGLLNELRNPQGLWQALAELLNADNEVASRFRLEMGGTISESIVQQLKQQQELAGRLDEVGYLPQNEVFEAYATCSVLILLLSNTETGKVIVPQKFFEYLTAGVPILAVGPADSELKQAMKGQSVGAYYEVDDVKGMKEFITKVFQHKYKYNRSDALAMLTSYSREAQTQKLAELLLSTDLQQNQSEEQKDE